MDRPSVYIPIDRRQAITRGETLPSRTEGAALFADISGFTPLTEALALELGPRRGAEELTKHLNQVYNAVIAELHRYGGSVIGFSGDAITCWLDGDDGRRATASALAMQQTMEQFASVTTHSGRVVSLGMKASVATGPVRRFLVGDPEHRIVDAMAGQTLERLASGEHQAERGDVVVDSQTVQNLGDSLIIREWRQDEETGQRFAAVADLALDLPESPWPESPSDTLSAAQVHGWLLPAVNQRLSQGQGEFLAELRPATALFLRFSGINYDQDPAAPEKLGIFIRQVEGILTRYDGSLIQLTIGDKGSYLYAAFGAPIAHEDDEIRAGRTALELQGLATNLDFLDDLQIGITQGRMRTGAYGSIQRRTYGVLGDAVNLSARLMSAAQPGQILVSDMAYEAAKEAFSWESLPAVKVKGKRDPVTLWRLADAKQQATAHRLQQPKYTLPMVGRAEELALIDQNLELALAGKGQIVGIAAEAGMGKSRLAAEVIRLANDKQLAGYAGECQSFGTNSSYLVWRGIWRAFFGVDGSRPIQESVKQIEVVLRDVNPTLVRRLPLLGPALNLPIPDNELTASLDAKIRKSSLEAMLVVCLRAWATKEPILLLLEDCHWLDPLSHDLVEVIGRALGNLPVLMLLVYRPTLEMRVQPLPYFSKIELSEFTEEEAESLIGLKLAQFFGPDIEMPPGLLEQVSSKAAGNPYYIEELLNYLHDRGIDPQDTEALAALDLPNSLYSLVLSRVDQLTEKQNAALKVASVIGRLFPAAMLWGVYPELGKEEVVKRNLQILSDLELTPMDTPEPELTYLFKNVIIQEVAYESLLYSTRAMLHERIGDYIESRFGQTLDQYLNLLAHHYGKSENSPKKREYLLKAAQAAQAAYDNSTAIAFYQQAIPLLSSTKKLQYWQDLGQVLELVGRWDEASEVYQQALSLAEDFENRDALALYQAAMAELTRKQGRYAEAASWLARAQEGYEALGDQGGVAQTLAISGILAAQQGDWDGARSLWEQSLAFRRQLNETARVASMLSNLGIVAVRQSDPALARTLYKEALALRRQLANPSAIANSLNNLGILALDQGHQEEARSRLEEALGLLREVGDRWSIGNALNNLGNVVRSQGDYDLAKTLYKESLSIYSDLGDKQALAYLLEDLGWLAALDGATERALRLVGAATTLREEVGAPLAEIEAGKLESALEPARATLDDATQNQATAEGQAMSLEQALTYAISDSN
jgi:class 3 adenylate cyclase/tetratricopeptide (TPR) repeat protein